MDFTFTEEQEAVAKVARQLFEHRCTPEHLSEVEAGELRHDAALWRELASADLLGVGLPETFGGNGGGFLELAVLLTEVGWSVAPVPAYATLVLGADTIARYGSDEQQARYLPEVIRGDCLLTAALIEAHRSDPHLPATSAVREGIQWVLTGAKELVPAGQLADAVIVSASAEDGPGLFLVDPKSTGVALTSATTTNAEPFADLILDGVSAQRLGAATPPAALAELHSRALAGLCAIQLGVTERALQLAANYTRDRVQFGRPIGSFQAVQQRMADAFIDVEAIRWTTWNAAWLIGEGRPADRAAAIAKFWAAEAGARVTATAQQVHGGMGLDITYPLSRYFLWAKHNELQFGSATAQLAQLGATYPEGPR